MEKVATMIPLPLLSEYDPAVSVEGSIDPLGLYGIADSLAVRMIPGVRERQKHPRFLTVLCVSLALCAEFDEDAITADQVSEPWQVFEWYVVEGLVRTLDAASIRGLPGQNKTAKAIQEGVPLSAKRYLKTPSVFGFHGVYRALSRELEIELGGRLGESGCELLTAWQREQGLPGFWGSQEGEGSRWRQKLVAALRDGLQNGAVSRGSTWQGWRFCGDHLAHLNPGPEEARLLAGLLNRGEGNLRREVTDFLASREGREAWIRNGSEREFHGALEKVSSRELRELLEAISSYERFCRLLQDAFDDCLHHLSVTRRKIRPQELAGLKGVVRANREAPEVFPEAALRLAAFDLAARLEEGFGFLGQKLEPDVWAEALMQHHRRVQGQKPPRGKASWIDRFDDGGYMVRPLYLRDKGGTHNDEYVHAYRTGSLFSFLTDLGQVKS